MRNALVIALMLFIALPAANAQTTAKREAKAKAKVLIKSGDLNYRLAKFKEALANYEAAYKLYEHPAILFNIAQCHRQLKNHEKALFFYRLCMSDWRRSNPNPPFLKEVRTQIGKLNDVMARERKEAQEKARLEKERKHKEAAAARKAEVARKEAELAKKAKLALIPTKKEPPRPAPSPFYKKWWFWTAVGAVVVGTTVAVAVGAQPGDPETVGGTLRPSDIYLD